MKNLNDGIIEFLREPQNINAGVPSSLIAEQFLKFKTPNSALAQNAVVAILEKDARARFNTEDGTWRAQRADANRSAPRVGGIDPEDETNISETPWSTVFVLADSAQKKIAHISIWSPLPNSNCIYNAWLADPKKLSEDDRAQMCDHRDAPFENIAEHLIMEKCAQILANTVPVFFSQRQYSIFMRCAQNYGIMIDDYYLLNQLLRAANINECKPLTIENVAAALLGTFQTGDSAYRQGELFCRVFFEIAERLKLSGVENCGQLSAALENAAAFDFTGKAINEMMIAKLPRAAGVYGFTDENGVYIYIGKAVNLRRRVEHYFRYNSESPEKLQNLREKAHGLTIHRCGSELEALIYEYRLIKKYSPPHNRQIDITERKGSYKPLDDMVILLPHAQDGFCVSVWVRRDQKIKLRAFELDFCEEEPLLRELREYFFDGDLPKAQTDFAELEIVTRWMKRNGDSVDFIKVSDCGGVEELLAMMKNRAF